jgi:hypothetical protein
MFALLRRVMHEDQLDGFSSNQLNPAKMPFIELAYVRLVTIIRERTSKSSEINPDNVVSESASSFNVTDHEQYIPLANFCSRVLKTLMAICVPQQI